LVKVFLSHGIDPIIITALRAALEARGDVLLPTQGTPLENRINHLFSADVAIVFFDPEVWYGAFELGIATARAVPVVIATRNAVTLPSELSGTVCVPWSDDSSEFACRLLSAIDSAAEAQGGAQSPHKQATPGTLPDTAEGGIDHVIAQLSLTSPVAGSLSSAAMFEKRVAAAFQQAGWTVREQGSQDWGADLAVERPDQGLIVVQIKAYTRLTQVGLPEVRQLIASGSMLGARRCVFVSTTRFSQSAIRFAREAPVETFLFTVSDLVEGESAAPLKA